MSATIAAIASPPGGGARGVIRVSGFESRKLAERVWSANSLGSAREIHSGYFDDGAGNQPGILIWMPGPRSFTREDVAEFHLPGSPFLLEAALARLVGLGAQIAEPGEFTRRAFVNGRIDLARAEGILELIEARDLAERRSATALLCGGLSERIEVLRDELADLRMLCEASLDFDETDTGHVENAELERRFASIRDRLVEAEGWEARRTSTSALPRVVLAGSANAGKSSLFNALCSERAIVSELAGTTRDVLRAEWKLPSSSCELIDTAGLEDWEPSGDDASSRLQRELRTSAEVARDSADLCLWVVDSSRPGLLTPPNDVNHLIVWNKCDAADAATPTGESALRVSASTGAGLAGLAQAVAERLGLAATSSESQSDTAHSPGRDRELSIRHRASLSRALETLELGHRSYSAQDPLELFADHLRRATDELDGITGQTTPEDLLDRIFGRFCLGK